MVSYFNVNSKCCVNVALIPDGLESVVIYSGKEVYIHCEEHGIFMHFPEHEMKKEITTTVTSLRSSTEDYVLPDDAELVSGVYQIHASEALQSTVDVEIQHCVCVLHPDEAFSMSFVHSNSNQGPPYQFTLINGGELKPNTRYGKIKLSSFSKFALVRFLKHLLRPPPPVICAIHVFSRQISPGKYEVHVVVTKDLKDTITVSIPFSIH